MTYMRKILTRTKGVEMIYSLYKSLATSLLSLYTTIHMLETVSLVSVQIVYTDHNCNRTL